jgi:2-polyprenyl-6-methoxyphenol hydroxylase-like FAD-dependent oxidoreductase
MSRIIVVGGGLVGLATALLIAKQGHEVTVLERDPQPSPATPEEAWDSWDRPGVMQFRMAHILLAGGWQVVREHLPELAATLVQAGGTPYTSLATMPPAITGRAPRPGDERFDTTVARRPVIEYAMAAAAADTIDIRRGVQVTGLLSDGQRRVTGVRLRDEDLAADLVIDAMGRKSPLPGWLAAIGAGAPAEESEDLGFVYYGRFFRPPTGSPQPPLGAIGLVHYDCYSLLTLPSEAGTWSVTVVLSARDHALRPLRDEANFTRLVSACPMHAPALGGEPVTGMMAAAGISDRRRDLVADGAPAALGVLAVGDAWSCTNPSLGRGMTLGLKHAVITAEAVAEHLGGDHRGDLAALALAHDRLTPERLLPWYQATIQADRQRAAQVAAVIEGRTRTPSGDPAAAVMRDLVAAMPLDPEVFRAYLEMMHALATPREILSRPGFAKRVSEVADGRAPTPPPGPNRAELLRMLS